MTKYSKVSKSSSQIKCDIIVSSLELPRVAQNFMNHIQIQKEKSKSWGRGTVLTHRVVRAGVICPLLKSLIKIYVF